MSFFYYFTTDFYNSTIQTVCTYDGHEHDVGGSCGGGDDEEDDNFDYDDFCNYDVT